MSEVEINVILFPKWLASCINTFSCKFHFFLQCCFCYILNVHLIKCQYFYVTSLIYFWIFLFHISPHICVYMCPQIYHIHNLLISCFCWIPCLKTDDHSVISQVHALVVTFRNLLLNPNLLLTNRHSNKIRKAITPLSQNY